MTTAKCTRCKALLIVIQPKIDILLGIKPKLENIKCEKCEDKDK